MPTTQLCLDFGIEHPVFSVGFGPAAGPELAAAVSEAGGFGVLGGSGMPPDEIHARIARTRAMTDKPFGVNVIIAAVELGMAEFVAAAEARIAAAVEEHVAAVVLFWGDPAPYVQDAHANGTKVLIQVGSLEEAERAAAAGVDAIIVQGVEAGGHVRAKASLWALLPTIAEAVARIPVLASGGVADGRGLAAVLALGAQGVSLGTRFVAAEEADIAPLYKQRVVDGRAEETWFGDLFDVGWPDTQHRVLRNSAVEEWEHAGRPASGERPGEGEVLGHEPRAWGDVEIKRYMSFTASPDFDGDLELVPLWAGESVSLVREVRPAGEIVREIARDADKVLARLGTYA